MLDDMIDYIADIRERPVWQPIPDVVRAPSFAKACRAQPSALADVYREFSDFVAPYATGNVHPGFMGWVHGGGTAVGMLAEMLAAGLNANLGGRDHMPIEVERQIVDWMRGRCSAFRTGASGIFVTGTSMANLMAVLVARTSALGKPSRQHGVASEGALADGLHVEGRAWLHRQGDGHCGPRQRCAALHRGRRLRIASTSRRCARRSRAIATPAASRSWSWLRPARSISAPSTISRRSRRYAARRDSGSTSTARSARSAILSPELAPRLAGIEQADSIALDFHKWGQVPYDAGFLLVRDGERHRAGLRGAGGLSAAGDARACRRLPSGPAISVRICRAVSAR